MRVLPAALLVALLSACSTVPPPRPAPLAFGVVADIQYADKDTRGPRRYREALGKLARCVADWNRRDLAFAIQLGDVIDGRRRLEDARVDLRRVLDVLGRLRAPLYHVIGNHGLSLPRAELQRALGLRRGYYDFARGRWRFRRAGRHGRERRGRGRSMARRAAVQAFLDAHPSVRGRLSRAYNGGVGAAQAAWLERTLAAADAGGERVIVFGHLPLLAAASHPGTLLWNHEEIASLLGRHRSVQAFFCGHHHDGGHAVRAGVHHVTFPALVNAPPGGRAWAVVELRPDRIEIRGAGTVPSRTLRLRGPG